MSTPWPVRANRDLEWGLAYSTGFLGLWMAMPWDAFGTPLFARVSAWGGEDLWGLAIVLSGFSHLFFLLANGAFHWTPQVRVASLCLTALLWTGLGVSVGLAGLPSMAVAFLCVMFFWTLACIYRASMDARITQARRDSGLPD